MRKIILKRKDGGVAIMHTLPLANLEETIKKFQDSHPEYIEHFEGEFDLPDSRLFRDAWTIKNNQIVVNEKKAAEIHLTRIRRVRDLELEKLDKEQLKYLSVPGMALEIDNKKQVLRDLPAKINDLNWPIELPLI